MLSFRAATPVEWYDHLMKRVALLIETSRTYGRDLLRGVKRYTEEHGGWSLFVEVRDLESKPPPWLSSWDGDGILVRSGSRAISNAVRRLNVPAVELRSSRAGDNVPFVGVDNEQVGKLVAEHFLERGFQHFGVYELDTEQFFVDRRNSFVRHLQAAGFDCSAFQQAGHTEKPSQWEEQQNRLIDWLQQLPRPVAVMACTDQLGCWLLDACRRAEIPVPEQIAVVGVENDETLAEMSSPPLSSLSLAGEKIGYEAARILDEMMNGKSPPREPVLIAPLRLETRLSSNILAINDPLLSQCLRLIRERACDGLKVADILEQVPISRSSLERGIRKLLGRSPNAEINRVRLRKVCELLSQTELTLEEIAIRTGFTTSQYLSELFRKKENKTPGEYRKSCRNY